MDHLGYSFPRKNRWSTSWTTSWAIEGPSYPAGIVCSPTFTATCIIGQMVKVCNWLWMKSVSCNTAIASSKFVFDVCIGMDLVLLFHKEFLEDIHVKFQCFVVRRRRSFISGISKAADSGKIAIQHLVHRIQKIGGLVKPPQILKYRGLLGCFGCTHCYRNSNQITASETGMFRWSNSRTQPKPSYTLPVIKDGSGKSTSNGNVTSIQIKSMIYINGGILQQTTFNCRRVTTCHHKTCFFSGLILPQKLVETDQVRKVGPKQGVVPQGPCKTSWRCRSPTKCQKYGRQAWWTYYNSSVMRALKKRGGNLSSEFSWNCPDFRQSLENRQKWCFFDMTFRIMWNQGENSTCQ